LFNDLESNSNKFYKILRYIHLFFLSNIYFLICNILLIISLALFEMSFYNIFLFFIPLIFLGPSLSALFYLFNKFLYSDKDLAITKEFFLGYKKNFFNTLKVWIPLLLITFIILFDFNISFLNPKLSLLIIPLIPLFIIDILVIIYSFIFISKYEITSINTLKLSCYILIKSPFTSIFNFIIILLCLFILLYSNSLLSLFIVGFCCYLILKNLKNTFLFIENTYIK